MEELIVEQVYNLFITEPKNALSFCDNNIGVLEDYLNKKFDLEKSINSIKSLTNENYSF